MASVEALLAEGLKDVPYKYLESLIEKKLNVAGVLSLDHLPRKLLNHCLEGNQQPFIWNAGEEPERTITISITDDDLTEVRRNIEKLMNEDLPRIIERTSDRSSKELLVRLKRTWPDKAAWDDATLAIFRENLEARWGKALDLLRMLLSICREIGEETGKRYRRSRNTKQQHLRDTLLRLHARACQVTDEIIVLLENGFADGAIARWRTLYEIDLVATVLSDHGEEMAARYVAHQIVEAKAAMDEYARSHNGPGDKPISKRERAKNLRQYNLLLAQHGRQFASPYGWAALDLGKKKPILADLEAAARRAKMRPHYKMASYNVHASARGIFFRLSNLEGSTTIAGASNVGLTDPGQNAAFTLASITALLFRPRQRIEELVFMRTLALLRDQTATAFYRAEQRLKRDHKQRK